MPALTYPTSDFVAFTKILSNDVNGKFNAIKTLLNTTKLDSTNVQSGGLTVDRLSISGGSAGQFLASNGSAVVYASNPLTAQYNVVIGSAAQVTAGTATHSTWASYTQADGDRVLVLPAYATTENVTISKKLNITGLGITSVITGTVTFATGGSYSLLKDIKVTGNITINSGLVDIFTKNIFQTSGSTYLIDSTVTGELVESTPV